MANAALHTYLTPLNLTFLAIVLFLLNRIYFELTTGAARRRMIAEYGCKPAHRYAHKGLLGRWFGLDVLKESIQSGREGRMFEANRLRNFNTGINTLISRRLTHDSILTIEPENVKTILATKFQDFKLGDNRRDVFQPLFGHGIFTNDEAAWERSRALIRPNFVRAQVADLDMFEHHVQQLIARIPKDGSTVDLQDLFFALTMDSATEFLFGKSTNTLVPSPPGNPTPAEEFVKAFVYATEYISFTLRTMNLARFIPNPRYNRAVKTIHAFADATVQDALNHPPQDDKKKYTFLHELVSRTQDPYTLRSELLNVLLAGRDTTAGLLSNTWHVLAHRPDIYAKLRAEVDALGGVKPDYQTLKDMKYLRYLLNESLRLMPVVPGNGRTAVRDTVLPLGGGPNQTDPVFVPKGMMVVYQPWSMHRRTDYFGQDALEFKPERWEGLRPGWEYLPFNGGPRICVGQQYALLEAGYVTVRLCQNFQGGLVGRDEREWREWLTITLSSGTGVKVGLYE